MALGAVALGAGGLAADGNGDGAAVRQIARYGYSFELIPGWDQAEGDTGLREVRLTPGTTVGPEEILIQQHQLSYDSAVEPQRPRRELRIRLAAAAPGRYAEFDPDASFAGRDVAYYRENPADGSTVDWYLLFQGRVQVSVGCRHTPLVAEQIEQACREVVRTLRIQ